MPQEDLRRFGADPWPRVVTPAWRELMRFEIARNRELYAQADTGIPMLPSSSARCVATARELYARILGLIEARDYDVFTGRARRTMMKMVVDQATDRVLGVHILGDDAPEMMQGVSVALTAGATKRDFDRTIGIHPTAAEELVTLRVRTRVAGLAQAAE